MSLLRLEATDPASLPEIVSLLREAFRIKSETPNFEETVLRWKYFEAGPPGSGSRSYGLRKGGQWVAHACAWPIRIASPRGPVEAIQMLDWASIRTAPGAGVMLARKLEALAPVLITTGGSPDTHHVLPRIGFEQRGSIAIYARVLRPWLQFRNRPPEGPKAAARLARNTLWSRSPLMPSRNWSARSAIPDRELHSRMTSQPVTTPESRYGAEFLEFMLRCPAARFRYFELRKQDRTAGFFLLARIRGQARLAALRILSSDPEDWTSAYAVAARNAADDPEACELIATAPVPLAEDSLKANGFRRRGATPLFIRDPQGLLAGEEHVALSMLDDDSAFLNDPACPYST